jgi:hypothetical protein
MVEKIQEVLKAISPYVQIIILRNENVTIDEPDDTDEPMPIAASTHDKVEQMEVDADDVSVLTFGDF